MRYVPGRGGSVWITRRAFHTSYLILHTSFHASLRRCDAVEAVRGEGGVEDHGHAVGPLRGDALEHLPRLDARPRGEMNRVSLVRRGEEAQGRAPTRDEGVDAQETQRVGRLGAAVVRGAVRPPVGV